MRFEGNSRGINRTDYQQFADFLGLGQSRNSKNNRCGAATQGEQANHTSSKPIGMVYGVKQDFIDIYDPEIGLENGTIFEELNKPFYPVGCKTKGGEGCL